MGTRFASIRANIRDFWQKVKPPICPVDRIKETCWEWTGSIDVYGYANYGSIAARRIAAVILTGRIAEGVSMSCENRACVNPHHIYRIKYYTEKEMIELDSAFVLRTDDNETVATRLGIPVSRVLRLRRLFPMMMIRDDREFIESLHCPVPIYPMYKERGENVIASTPR